MATLIDKLVFLPNVVLTVIMKTPNDYTLLRDFGCLYTIKKHFVYHAKNYWIVFIVD